MRTQDEILNRIASLENEGDVFGFQRGTLIESLDYEHAKPYLKDGVTTDQWQPKLTREDVLAEMLDYMQFAWEKATGERGLSASRSISRLTAWTWLLGDIDIENDDYYDYGKPILKRICEHYGWNWEQWL